MSWWSSVLVKEWEGMALWGEMLGEGGELLGVARAQRGPRSCRCAIDPRVMQDKRV
jgi:hypothetical protein